MTSAFRHLSPVAPDKLARVLQAWPDVPDDYLLFLAEYGAGSVADTFTEFILAYQQEPG